MPTPSLPSRLHRMRWKLVAGATAIALSLGAAAALPTNLANCEPTPCSHQGQRHPQGHPGHRRRVTVTTLADGKQTADVDRPDNAAGGVRIQQIGGDLFVLPDEALPLLTADKLDRRLFNVTDLIEMGYDDAKSAERAADRHVRRRRRRAAAEPAAPRGSKLIRELAGIGGAALSDREEAGPRRSGRASRRRGTGRATTLGSGWRSSGSTAGSRPASRRACR